MGEGTITEEEVRDMERRAAFEAARTAAQNAKNARAPVMSSAGGPRSRFGPPTEGAPPPSPPPPAFSSPNDTLGPAFRPEPSSSPEPPPPPPPEQVTPDHVATSGASRFSSGGPTNAVGTREPEEVTPPSPQGDAPMMGGGGGAPVMISPGGMQPYTEKTEVKAGKMVSPEVKQAYGAASGLQLEGAGIEHDANAELFKQQHAVQLTKIAASDQARLDHQRIAEDRDRMVADRLGQIEDLNKQAQGKPEDMWGSGHIFARVVGTLLSGVGVATMLAGGRGGIIPGIAAATVGGTINSLITEDIETKLRAQKGAAAQAKRQTDLLGLHLDAMKDREKAVDATKLAYYDNVLQQLDGLKMGPYGEHINDAKFLQVQGGILEDRAKTAERIQTKEQSDIQRESVAKMAAPKFAGGGAGAGLKDIPNTITLSDKTTWELGSSPESQKAHERIVAMQKLQTLNDRIKELRGQAYKLDPFKDHEEYAGIYAELEDKGSQKAPLMSQALDGSVLRDAERTEMYKKNVKATEGLGVPGVPYSNKVPVYSKAQQGAADRVLSSQQSLWHDAQKTEASAAGGRQVQRGYVSDENGNLRPVGKYTGRNAAPTEHRPPDSFKGDDPKRKTETRGRPLSESYEDAPNFGFQKSAAPSSKKKKKDKE